MTYSNSSRPAKSDPAEKSNKPYAVRALLVKGQQILLIHHFFADPAMFDKWTFPGGRLDPHETDPLQALHREMEEELSLEVEVLGKVGRFFSRSGLDYTIFAVRPLGPIGPLKPDEIRETTWLTPAEIYEWHTKDKLQFGFEMEAVSVYLKKFM
jgi:8-oxo-dGTP pyrophosphatase MutT (NUDIX family)